MTPDARGWIEDPANDVLFSAANIWEIAIKAGSRRPEFLARPDEVADAAPATGFTERVVGSRAAARVDSLSPHHRDPFDRLLVAQAIFETARLLTADARLVPCSELVVLIGRAGRMHAHGARA